MKKTLKIASMVFSAIILFVAIGTVALAEGQETVKLSNKTRIVINTGSTYKFGAVLLPPDDTQTIFYSSSDPSIATIDQNGNVKALKAGKTSIKAYLQNGTSSSCQLTVYSAIKTPARGNYVKGSAYGRYLSIKQLSIIKSKGKEIVKKYTKNTQSEYTKAKNLYDWMIRNVKYKSGSKNNLADAYGALVNKRANGVGFACGLKLLYEEAGLKCYMANINNAYWNIVRISGRWYHSDAQTGAIYLNKNIRSYFLVSDETMTTLSVKTDYKKYPACPMDYGEKTPDKTNYLYPGKAFNESVIVGINKARSEKGYSALTFDEELSLQCDQKIRSFSENRVTDANFNYPNYTNIDIRYGIYNINSDEKLSTDDNGSLDIGAYAKAYFEAGNQEYTHFACAGYRNSNKLYLVYILCKPKS